MQWYQLFWLLHFDFGDIWGFWEHHSRQAIAPLHNMSHVVLLSVVRHNINSLPVHAKWWVCQFLDWALNQIIYVSIYPPLPRHPSFLLFIFSCLQFQNIAMRKWLRLEENVHQRKKSDLFCVLWMKTWPNASGSFKKKKLFKEGLTGKRWSHFALQFGVRTNSKENV